jgi:hypothetical protein
MSGERAKGTRFETAVCDYLREHFPRVERRAMSGSRDRGDIAGIPETVIECKDQRRVELALWVDQATAEAMNAGVPLGVVVHKRLRRPIRDAYVTMPLREFALLLVEARANDGRV